MYPIPELNDFDIVFPTKALQILPPYKDIAEEFKRDSNKWVKVAHDWFYCGLKEDKWKPKDGVDQNKALRVIQACLGDFSPSQEHKMAGVAFLLSEWFDDVTYTRGKP
jgi:hypothetical protein